MHNLVVGDDAMHAMRGLASSTGVPVDHQILALVLLAFARTTNDQRAMNMTLCAPRVNTSRRATVAYPTSKRI